LFAGSDHHRRFQLGPAISRDCGGIEDCDEHKQYCDPVRKLLLNVLKYAEVANLRAGRFLTTVETMSVIITKANGGYMIAETVKQEADFAETSTPCSQEELRSDLKKRGMTEKVINTAIEKLKKKDSTIL
jgi:hypothetical protein